MKMYDYRDKILGLAERALQMFVSVRLDDLGIQYTWKNGLKHFIDSNYPEHMANYKQLYVFLKEHTEQKVTLESMDITALSTLTIFYLKDSGIFKVSHDKKQNQLFINHVTAIRELRNTFDHYPKVIPDSDGEKFYFDQLCFSSSIAGFATLIMKYKSITNEWKLIYHNAKAIESSLHGERWLSIDSHSEKNLSDEEDLSNLIALSEQVNVEAQIKLGKAYYHGDRIKRDEEKAYVCIRKAAIRGNIEAEYYLGLCIFYGTGTDHDTSKAFEWIRKSAENGFAAAQYKLGMYYNTTSDRNFQQSPEQKQECFKWTKMAADQEYPEAVWLLGGLYSRGIGVTQDLGKADSLIHQASNLGCYQATEELARRAEKAARENGEWEKALELYNLAKTQNTDNNKAYQSQIKRCMRETKKEKPDCQ